MAIDMQGGEIEDVALVPPPPFGEGFHIPREKDVHFQIIKIWDVQFNKLMKKSPKEMDLPNNIHVGEASSGEHQFTNVDMGGGIKVVMDRLVLLAT
jgi:hypothetical protein